jgi:hypothetical protein
MIVLWLFGLLARRQVEVVMGQCVGEGRFYHRHSQEATGTGVGPSAELECLGVRRDAEEAGALVRLFRALLIPSETVERPGRGLAIRVGID